MNISKAMINWLLNGDPSISFQVKRDLLKSSSKEIITEQNKISIKGWGNKLLAKQDPEGTWAKGLYSPKWISTTYTLLILRRLGLSQNNASAKKGAIILINKGYYNDGGINYFGSLNHSETCVTGMILSIISYFKIDDKRLDDLATFLFEQQMPDGGWNCLSFKGAKHSSFHTTLLVLEGLREYEKITPYMANDVKASRDKAIEFLLQHHLYKSDKSGRIIDSRMTRFPFPYGWRYDVISALDFMQEVNTVKDDRMTDSIELLVNKKTKEGYWNMQTRQSGRVYFEIEKVGKPSRWNTLRALRILKWLEEKNKKNNIV